MMLELAPYACLVCGTELTVESAYQGTHPACELMDDNNMGSRLGTKIGEIIKWADANSPRSQQTALGPSEIGTPCTRRLAYRLAGVPVVNHYRDPWAAIVGTAIHAWLEKAVIAYGDPRFETEAELEIDPALTGHSDLFVGGVVVDYKTGGAEVMREVHRNGPSRAYRIQTQLYGLGQQRAGREVTHVALVFLPRSGRLSGMYVWVDQFRPHIANAAIQNMYKVAGQVTEGLSFEDFPAMEDHCGYCPWYRKEGLMGVGKADETGCPGS